MVQRGLELDLYQNSARKYLGFCIKMVRKGNKYLDLVFKWCEKCQRRRELLTVGRQTAARHPPCLDNLQKLLFMKGIFQFDLKGIQI